MTYDFQNLGNFISTKDKAVSWYIVYQEFFKEVLENPTPEIVDMLWDRYKGRLEREYKDSYFPKYDSKPCDYYAPIPTLYKEKAFSKFFLKAFPKEESVLKLARMALDVSETPEIKERLKNTPFMPVGELFPDMQKIFDNICKLPFGEVEKLLSAKPMIDNFEKSYATAQAETPKLEDAKPKKRKARKSHDCQVPKRVPELEKWLLIYEYYEMYCKARNLRAQDFYSYWQMDDEHSDRPLATQMLKDIPRLQILLDEGRLGHIHKKANSFLGKNLR
ncbi:MAG: hypothetical protein IT310_15330 [Anaerolineales bacterium]|nr:hypothetical protein [Anaerolineales bacterium]